MIKRFFLTMALAAGLLSPAYSAGTLPGISLSQQLDNQSHVLAACLLYTYAAGTTTPQSAYSDSGLTIPLPNPQTCDANGRLPQMFFADGSIKIRLTNSAGVVQLAADGLAVVGASSGGGGGSPVDPTTILQTGQIISMYGTGNLTGFVRLNGRTVGSATSGASERANSDVLALFTYLWQTDANLVVSTGRGVSAAADWAANKTITLPDGRGRALAGLDDMGNSSAARLASLASTTLGTAGGAETVTLAQANLPNATLALTGTTNTTGAHTHTTQVGIVGGGSTAGSGTSGTTGGNVSDSQGNHSHTVTGTTASINGNTTQTTVNKLPPMLLVTNYIKL